MQGARCRSRNTLALKHKVLVIPLKGKETKAAQMRKEGGEMGNAKTLDLI